MKWRRRGWEGHQTMTGMSPSEEERPERRVGWKGLRPKCSSEKSSARPSGDPQSPRNGPP